MATHTMSLVRDTFSAVFGGNLEPFCVRLPATFLVGLLLHLRFHRDFAPVSFFLIG